MLYHIDSEKLLYTANHPLYILQTSKQRLTVLNTLTLHNSHTETGDKVIGHKRFS